MPSLIKNPKDFWSGVMFLAFGGAAVLIARDYSMGSAGRMGPAYFPTMLGALLAILGAIAVVRSLFTEGEAIEKFKFKELGLILVSVLLFGILVRGAGLVIATITLVIVGAYASMKFRWVPAIALAVGAAIFCVLVFVTALGLPMPIIGPWFGF